MHYTIAHCALGVLLLAATERGICSVRLGDDAAELERDFLRDETASVPRRDDAALAEAVAAVKSYLDGMSKTLDLPVDAAGTPFQQAVWQALQAIPYGETRTYRQVAVAIGRPKAVRAVGTACGANPVALLVPCHRVVCSDGGLGGYYWGLDRKRALLALEGANVAPGAPASR